MQFHLTNTAIASRISASSVEKKGEIGRGGGAKVSENGVVEMGGVLYNE